MPYTPQEKRERLSALLQQVNADPRVIESLAAMFALLQFCLTEMPQVLSCCATQETKIANQQATVAQLQNEINTLRQKLGMTAE